MFERLVRRYATTARNCGGNRIVLLIDEAQDMHQPEFETICNLENALDQLGFKLIVICVGSHELNYQHQVFIHTGKIHLNARYMVRFSRFRGIADVDELKSVLNGYDDLTDWPEGSGISFTRYLLKITFDLQVSRRKCGIFSAS
jgi:hypothetical protein